MRRVDTVRTNRWRYSVSTMRVARLIEQPSSRCGSDLSRLAWAMINQEPTTNRSNREETTMAFHADTTFNELHPHFQEHVRRNELLAHHSAFGVGGPADVWVSLTSKEELVDLVRLCAERHYPLLITGNGTNVLYADAGVRGIVARVALDAYRIEDHGDETALLIAEAGLSWPRLLHELAPLGWAGLEFGIGIPGTLGGGVISNAGAHNDDLGQVLAWIEVLDARGSNVAGEDQLAVPLVRRYLHDELDLGYRHSRFRAQQQARFDTHGHLLLPPRDIVEPPELIIIFAT